MSKAYKKLVRDKIPEIIRAAGQEPVTRILDDQEFLDSLITKLGEETAEFAAEPSLEELADLQEVLDAIREQLGYDAKQLADQQQHKCQERGGFEKRIYLEEVKDV